MMEPGSRSVPGSDKKVEIMILTKDGRFVLSTNNTTYAFDTLATGHLEHLYYGARIDFSDDLKEFEVINEIWGEENPCQIYVLKYHPSAREICVLLLLA